MNKVPYDTKSEDQNDFCEECLDTGIVGDNGPGTDFIERVAKCPECGINVLLEAIEMTDRFEGMELLFDSAEGETK